MSDVDRAASLTELLAEPGVVEVCELGSSIGVMAYHGGHLEWMTDVVAERVAARTGASLYSIVQPTGMRRHLPSTRVRAEESSRLAGFLDHVDTVVTIHGFGRRGFFDALLLGGRNRSLAEHVGDTLRRHLPAYRVVTDLDHVPKPLRGQHPDNPVNVPPRAGVQIELPPRVRGSSPMWWDWEGPALTPHTEALIDGLVEAVDAWPTTTAR